MRRASPMAASGLRGKRAARRCRSVGPAALLPVSSGREALSMARRWSEPRKGLPCAVTTTPSSERLTVSGALAWSTWSSRLEASMPSAPALKAGARVPTRAAEMTVASGSVCSCASPVPWGRMAECAQARPLSFAQPDGFCGNVPTGKREGGGESGRNRAGHPSAFQEDGLLKSRLGADSGRAYRGAAWVRSPVAPGPGAQAGALEQCHVQVPFAGPRPVPAGRDRLLQAAVSGVRDGYAVFAGGGALRAGPAQRPQPGGMEPALADAGVRGRALRRAAGRGDGERAPRGGGQDAAAVRGGGAGRGAGEGGADGRIAGGLRLAGVGPRSGRYGWAGGAGRRPGGCGDAATPSPVVATAPPPLDPGVCLGTIRHKRRMPGSDFRSGGVQDGVVYRRNPDSTCASGKSSRH